MYFASVIGGLILTFAITHWSHRMYRRFHLLKISSARSLAAWSTPVIRLFYGSRICNANILPERVVMATVYFGVNIGVSVWDIDWHHYTTFANRLGW